MNTKKSKEDPITLQETYTLDEILPIDDKTILDFAEKYENLIFETLAKFNQLHEEGSNLVAKDLLKLTRVSERNRFVQARLHNLKRMSEMMIISYEQTRKEV